MRAAYPNEPEEADTDVRRSGTACHWLAQEVWNGRNPAEGSLAPNGRVLTEEMFDAVDMYLDVLRAWQRKNNRADILVEQPVPCDHIHPLMADGTPDAAQVDMIARVIRVGDLKFGFKFVEVWENWQLMIYASALLRWWGISGLDEQHWWVELTIVQPRSYHRDGQVRTWRVRATDLRAYINIAIAAAAQAGGDCTVNPGCTDCPGRHACMTLQNSAASAIEQSYGSVPLELTPAAVGDELRRLAEAMRYMEARITGLQTQAESMLRGGSVVPGWRLGAGYARETWREGSESLVLALAAYYGNPQLAKPTRAITPNQARKAGLPADVVAVFAHKPSTGVKLIKQDPNEAKKAFQSQGE